MRNGAPSHWLHDAKCSTFPVMTDQLLIMSSHACFCACSVPPSRLPSILLQPEQPEQAAHAHQQQGKRRPVYRQAAVCSPLRPRCNNNSSSSRHSTMMGMTQTSQCGASKCRFAVVHVARLSTCSAFTSVLVWCHYAQFVADAPHLMRRWALQDACANIAMCTWRQAYPAAGRMHKCTACAGALHTSA
jgi:hypothetical protein